MAEIVGIGISHYPELTQVDENMSGLLKLTLKDPGLPDFWRDPANWPESMREEWDKDEGTSAAARHRQALVAGFRKMREELDRFKPDFIVIWGDDQYENFIEDIVPPFCVMAYDKIETEGPYGEWWFYGPNAWNEPKDKKFTYRGHRHGAKDLVTGLLAEGFDVSYAYKPLHKPLSHAFLLSALFLDYDRKGFDYPIVPFQINCYGRWVISQKAGLPDLAHPLSAEDLDPPSPTPERVFQMGAATARVLARSPWRVALIASSSWSHAFLTAKNHYLYPDREADCRLFDAMVSGDYDTWRTYPVSQVEDSGQLEVLNWHALVGAMAELGRRKPDEATLVQTYIFNSSKVFAVFRP